MENIYIANPVKVMAYAIRDVIRNGEEGYSLTLSDGSEYTPSREMLARHIPETGDYLVRQEDGYTYINPREVFERKYRPEDAKVGFASADREIVGFLNDVADKIKQRGEEMEEAVVIYGKYGGTFYVDSTASGVHALGVMEVGKATMLGAIVKATFLPEQ